jgi:hypothetical protein
MAPVILKDDVKQQKALAIQGDFGFILKIALVSVLKKSRQLERNFMAR